ncbi:3-phosphoinositide-dependent protein kinase 2 [Solanum stenotomum]|uniref:3-phosphoinositide-dependent protein kinase 2 n=1 Tax=Solanum stenotomum TaxID=172797 RepID=UPI0020D10516|nr:3-phosphoinositide-dependent protein kinase 2 [Solanum stenotomum]
MSLQPLSQPKLWLGLHVQKHINEPVFIFPKNTHVIHLYISENLFCLLTCIQTTQDIDPSRRPGAGPDGYASLKNHPFFSGVDWDNLRLQTPPRLAAEPKGHSTRSSGEDQDPSWNPSHIGDGSARTNDGNGGTTSSSEVGSVTRLASIDSFDSKWKQFLEPGESVLMISNVKKIQKLTSKKVQLILTNKPKLIYVDPSKLVVKGNIIWSDNSNDLNIQVISPSQFKVCTPKKVMSFEDAKQRAMQWKKAIETLQNR